MSKIKILVVSGLPCFCDGICSVIEKENLVNVDRGNKDDVECVCFALDVIQIKATIFSKFEKRIRDLRWHERDEIDKILSDRVKNIITMEKPDFAILGMSCFPKNDFYDNENTYKIVIDILKEKNIRHYLFTSSDYSFTKLTNIVREVKSEQEKKMLVRA